MIGFQEFIFYFLNWSYGFWEEFVLFIDVKFDPIKLCLLTQPNMVFFFKNKKLFFRIQFSNTILFLKTLKLLSKTVLNNTSQIGTKSLSQKLVVI